MIEHIPFILNWKKNLPHKVHCVLTIFVICDQHYPQSDIMIHLSLHRLKDSEHLLEVNIKITFKY